MKVPEDFIVAPKPFSQLKGFLKKNGYERDKDYFLCRSKDYTWIPIDGECRRATLLIRPDMFAEQHLKELLDAYRYEQTGEQFSELDMPSHIKRVKQYNFRDNQDITDLVDSIDEVEDVYVHICKIDDLVMHRIASFTPKAKALLDELSNDAVSYCISDDEFNHQ